MRKTNAAIMQQVYAEIRCELTTPERTYVIDVDCLRVLNRIHNNCPIYWELHDRYLRRLALNRAIRDKAEHGEVVAIESGMDCDCVQYTGKRHTIEANIKAYNELEDKICEWADGPFSLSIVSPSEATGVNYVSRDRALEAYENGHPGNVVVPSDVNADAPY